MVVKKKNPCVPSDPSTTNAAAARPSSRVRSSCDTIPMLDPSQARKRWLRNASRSPVGSQSWTVTSRRVSPGGVSFGKVSMGRDHDVKAVMPPRDCCTSGPTTQCDGWANSKPAEAFRYRAGSKDSDGDGVAVDGAEGAAGAGRGGAPRGRPAPGAPGRVSFCAG